MSEDLLEQYEKARQRFERAQEKVRGTIGVCRQMANALEAPSQFLNPDVSMQQKEAFESRMGAPHKQWPTLDDIQGRLDEWRAAREEMRELYGKFSPSLQQIVKSPNEVSSERKAGR
jgi:DNA repair exonuclease SbcCD ATPase subunit